MMNRDNENWDDQQMASLFSSTEHDGASPDQEFLDRLREQSEDEFVEANTQQTEIPERRKRMLVLATRTLAAAIATAVIVAASFWGVISPGETALALGNALENVAQADTVRIELDLRGHSFQLLAKGDRLRLDAPDGTYQIAHGETIWDVDEKANRATSSKSPYFQPKQSGLNVVRLLELPAGISADELLRAKPAEQIERDGHLYNLYRVDLAKANRPIQVEALVDAKSQLLQTLETKTRRDGKWHPLRKITVVAVNDVMDEEKFVVGDTLTEDGRVGKVADAQGIVTVKPVMHKRFSPLQPGMLIKPGDWVRTDNRGANAVKIRLVKQTDVTLGPGTLVEITSPRQIKLISGELKINAQKKAPIELLGANGEKIVVASSKYFRLDRDEKLAIVKKDPPWLRGFEGATANESIGSLVAKVDGRDVPLTVGYHKVTVDIRDQIARTVIEESFVNHTKGRLEGVFYFPLPQDASISGFGMWIGSELVEADVVEKQRAREIYETILRENRDPGLLEWSGGNLFKARVFPIEAHSEKRIKITYTQVLPVRGGRYRYSYALQSEMLKKNPLRDLGIELKVHSASRLAKVSSPTHTTRIDMTDHSAHVEFAAQDYTPSRDFEVVVEVDDKQPEVVLIPHRRGDDGYFMLQLLPPNTEGEWQRDVLPDGKPLELLLLADTSASLDRAQRQRQAEFIASILSTLTPDDKFNLAGCDLACNWVFKKPQAANDENIKNARRFLDGRISLGWTDLDKTFASALKQCNDNTQVIYIGDGTTTTGDGDPVAASGRLRQLCEGKAKGFHAVAPGSLFEPVILKTIAALGGGSVRQITGEKTPQTVAAELLGEIARPSIRDLKVEFRDLQVARVYPEQLPNLPAGTQQIVLARYLPEGSDQKGEVIVTGTFDGKPVRFKSRVLLQDAEKGNSFIPRLWARMHLDALLEQGTASVVKDEIISLSEEYHIMTPYTSLLVLESDEDRERFKVKRRFQMRDGEKFFAEGRDGADYELIQKQMRLAGNWRTGLRRDVLRELASLGRNPHLFEIEHAKRHLHFTTTTLMSASRSSRGRTSLGFEYTDGLSIGGTIRHGHGMFDKDLDISRFGGDREWNFLERDSSSFDGDATYLGEEDGRGLSTARNQPHFAWETEELQDSLTPISEDDRRKGLSKWEAKSGEVYAYDMQKKLQSRSSYSGTSGGFIGGIMTRNNHRVSQQYSQWLHTLFAHLAPKPPVPGKLARRWPAEARVLAESLLRTKQLAKLKGGLDIQWRADRFDSRFNLLTSRSETFSLVSPKSWLTRSQSVGSQGNVQWCDAKRRGVFSEAYLLGRDRESTPRDQANAPLGLGGYVLSSLERRYFSYDVKVEPQGENRTLLILSQPPPANQDYELRILIDTERHVMLSLEHLSEGKITSSTRFSEFVQISEAWWATRIEGFDKQNRRTSLTTQQFKTLSDDAFAQEMKQHLTALQRVQLIHEPTTTVIEAKQAVANGKATFDHQLVLLIHFSQTQQWDRVLEHLEEAEKLAEGKPGVRWIRNAVLQEARRGEELKERLRAEAAGFAKQPSDSDLFLANYLLGQASSVLSNDEMLLLLDVLKPVYTRQPERIAAPKQWMQQRIRRLQQAGQNDEAFELRKKMTTDFPRDAGLQTEYSDALARRGEFKAAYAWLDRALANNEAQWHDHELDSLRLTYTHWLRNQGRYPELLKFLANWIEQNPKSLHAYQQYLSALIRTDDIDGANKLMEKWFKQGQVEGQLPLDGVYRLQAAISQMLGQGYNMRTNRIDERWYAPLAKAVLFFAQHKTQHSTADRIMSNGYFTQSDECREVRRKVARLLIAKIDSLPPHRVGTFVSWIWTNDPAVESRQWKRIADRLEKRWVEQTDATIKQQLASPLIRVLNGRVGAEEHLAFLRRQLTEGPKKHRTQYASQLFSALLAQPWKADHEDEAFGLIPQLSESKEAAERLRAELKALHQMTNRMVQARYDAAMAKLEHPENLTRIELRDKQAANKTDARRDFAKRLTKAGREHDDALAKWMLVERLYLDIQTDNKLDKVAEQCWEILGPKPKKLSDTPTEMEILDEIRRGRCLTMLSNLAARSTAKPELGDRLLAYIDEGFQTDPKADGWKNLKYQILIALDRPKNLEKVLREWIRDDDSVNRWRVSLAYLLAEQAKIVDAIKLLEKVKTADELGPTELRTLADWYMVVDRRDEHEQALIDVYQTMEEWRMSNWLSQRLQPWQRNEGQLPSELDKRVLRMFAAIFEKSSNPGNYLYIIRNYYQATHDFRLLAAVVDGVTGHTAGKVYPLLQNLDSVLQEVRDEATADSLVEQVKKRREHAKSDVDRRALDLVELFVERRSSEILNQPGPHVERALTAMQSAFKRKWSDGEPRLMADLLASLGRISQKELSDEQLRELVVLHREATKGTIDRLHIASAVARTYWSYSRHNEAIDLLQAALDEYQNASDGVLPTDANAILDLFISYLEQRGHHARAEKVLFAQIEKPINLQQDRWLTLRLYRLYTHAVGNRGTVSLGTGEVLFKAAEQKMRDALDTHDHNHRYQVIDRLCTLYRTANEEKFGSTVEQLKDFAFMQIPKVLKQQTNNYQSIAQRVASTLHDVASPRVGLEFLIDRIETEPKWFRFNNQNGWRQFSWQFAYWRSQVGDVGDLKKRLLAIVTEELRRDLQTRQSHNRNMYHDNHSYFWREMADEFAKTANEVYAQQKTSGASVKYIAEYLYRGLDRHDRAIEILFAAFNETILDESGQSQLVKYLHSHNRHGESIAVLQPLVEKRPSNMQYRVWLMHAYFRTGRQAELLTLLKQTDEYFHLDRRWNEHAMSSLAHSCLENKLFKQSAKYYEELIPLHQRTQPRRGIGNGTLSNYYANMARAYAGLNNTAKAVDAACGAIISWGPRLDNRKNAISSLRQVLRDSPNLDAYVADLDKESKKTGLDKPIVRKALGMVYAKKKQWAEATAQLERAIELQPNDTETHQELIDCYDQQNDKAGAIQQLLQSLELSRRDIKLYKSLGDRLKEMEQTEETERAYTSIVEALPAESESHALLAEVRQQQDRWAEAIVQWQQVARIRELEPTGLQKLAAAQIHQKQWDAATETLDKLDKGWPPRFRNVDDEIRKLRKQIEEGKGKPVR